MAKCKACNERKGDRFCPGLNASICSLCCGAKREDEIRCVRDCQYLKKGKAYQLACEIEKKIISDLRAETSDVFEMEEVAAFAMALEGFFVDRFYDDGEVNDHHISEALTKIYAVQQGILPGLAAENKSEESIFQKFNELTQRFSNVPEALKRRAMLRIIKSIRSSSGGALGNRNYLEMIYSQHTGKGKWADLFRRLESPGEK
jgi:hypothetical protein